MPRIFLHVRHNNAFLRNERICADAFTGFKGDTDAGRPAVEGTQGEFDSRHV